MREQIPEPHVAQAVHEPRETEPEDALFGLFVLLFGGTVLVGLLYLAFD